MQPIIPPQMAAQPLGEMDGSLFGLIGRADMEGYAAHFAVGIPWFTTQSPYLRLIAPPSCTDPLYLADLATRRHHRAPAIEFCDRAQLRQKYAEIARLYLSGEFKGFHTHGSVPMVANKTPE